MTRALRALALLPAGLALVLYLATCSPTINFLDSGELTTVAWTLGIAHPPGYPLYTLISSAFIQLPLGPPAWRMNLLSALFAAGAVGLFYGLVADTLLGAGAGRRAPATRSPARPALPAARPRGKGARRSPPADRPPPATAPALLDAGNAGPWLAAAAGLTAAGLLACSLTFWNWATQAKMYSLHFAFMAGLLWLALRTRRALLAEEAANAPAGRRWSPATWSPGIRRLHLLAVLAGLSMTNHYLSNLLWPGIALLLLIPAGRVRSPWRRIFRHTPTVVVAGLAPLLLYLYLPIRAGGHPLLDWGSPDTWGDFWRHVTVWQFRVYIGQDAGQVLSFAGDALIFAANQFGLLLSLLLLVPIGAGLAYLWRTDRALLAATVLTALVDVVYTLNYQIREVVVYYIPCYMIALWWAGLGLAAGLGWARSRWPERGPRLFRQPATLLAVGALLPLLALGANVGAAGHRDDYTEELFVRNAFQNFRPNAVVLTNSWDLVSGAYYLQHVLHERTDVAIVDKALFRYPFYVSYIARTYPALVQPIADQYREFQAEDRTWVDTGTSPPGLPTLYTGILSSFIERNLGQRPVYVVFNPGDAGDTQEQTAILAKYQTALVPDGLGYRVAATPGDHSTGDPGFDLRGLTTARVPLDEVAYSVIWQYPAALEQIGTYLRQNGSTPEQQQLGARLLTQAQSLAPFGANPQSRPTLR